MSGEQTQGKQWQLEPGQRDCYTISNIELPNSTTINKTTNKNATILNLFYDYTLHTLQVHKIFFF